MNLYSDAVVLEAQLVILTGKDDVERKKASKLIKFHVEAAARELSLERFANFESQLYRQILGYVRGDNMGEKMGGILAIRELIDCTSAAAEGKVHKFANTLSVALKANTDFGLIILVAEALGHMARYSPVSQVEFVENELSRGLEWLRPKGDSSVAQQPHRRIAACSILEQLADNAPTIFFVRTSEFFELIWGPLRDPKEPIRLAAAKALSACLAVLKQRTYHLQWYFNIYEQVHEGFKKGSPESIHGSLLVTSEVLRHTGQFMVPRFKEICDAIFKLKDHKSRTIRLAITRLLPELAFFCPDAFARSYLDESVDIIVKYSKTAELRPQVLQSMGKLCQIEGSFLMHRVDELLLIIKEALASAKKNKEVLPEALVCVSDMVMGLGSGFHSRVLILLDSMIACGLNPELINTLSIIIDRLPERRLVVQQRILEEVMRVLGGDSRIFIAPPKYTSSWTRKTVYTANNSNVVPAISFASPIRQTQVGGARDPNANGNRDSTALSTSAGRSGFIGFGGGASSALSAGRNSFRASSSTPKSAKKTFFSRSTSHNNMENIPLKSNVAASISVAAMGLEVGINYNPSTDVDSPYPIPVTTELIILCLKTLGNLHLPSFSLIVTLQRSVLPYLESDVSSVRNQAALTCSTMLSRFIRGSGNINLCGPTASATEAIIRRLLEMAVADPSQIVRTTVLQSFGPEFDIFLRRSNHVNILLYLLSDDSLDVKINCLKVAGRLSTLNPAAVLPALRQVLLQLISEIRNSCDKRSKEDAVIMLCSFIRSGTALQKLVKSFIGILIQSLQVTSDVRLTTVKLEALGELCMVMGQDIIPFVDELMPVIVSNMHDPSSRLRQERAIKTLGQLVSATGYVVLPYLQFPVILPGSLDTLFKNTANPAPWPFRKEILRTLGLIGALEPHKFELIKEYLHNVEKNKLNIEKNLGSASRTLAITDAKERDTLTVDNKKGETSPQTLIVQENEMSVLPAHLFMYEQCIVRAYSSPKATSGAGEVGSDKMKNNPTSDEYCPRVAISALMRILRDSSLSVHHSAVTQAIVMIFKSLGMKCVPLLEQIMPYLLQVVRHCGAGLRESILQQLSQLASIVRHHLSPYLPPLFDIICEHWHHHLEHILALVEEVALYCADEFNDYLPRVLPLLQSSLSIKNTVNNISMLATATNTKSPMRALERTLACHDTLRGVLKPYLHLVIPSLCRLIMHLQELGPDANPWLLLSIRTLRRVFSNGALLESQSHVASKIVHCLTTVISRSGTVFGATNYNTPPVTASNSSGAAQRLEIAECIKALCVLAEQFGNQFIPFDRLVRQPLKARNLSFPHYDEIMNAIYQGKHRYDGCSGKHSENIGSFASLENEIVTALGPTGREFWSRREGSSNHGKAGGVAAHLPVQSQQKLQSNQQHLQRAWDVSQRSTSSDWNEWLRRFIVELLRESPSASLRACSSLAQAYVPLGKELFHAAFVSCWLELTDAYQDNLVKSLQSAFQSPTMPPEILQSLLNLAEFMEHDVGALPISPAILAGLAEKSRAYAKALHYCEIEFQSNPATCFESLININKKLDQHESALGVLRNVEYLRKKHPATAAQYTVRDSWLAKLGHWEVALGRYEARLQANPNEPAGIAGKLKCLEALGRWEECIDICTQQMQSFNTLEFASTSSREHASIVDKGGTAARTVSSDEPPESDVEQKRRLLSLYTKSSTVGATAAWALNRWDTMDHILNKNVEFDTVDVTLMKAALCVHKEEFSQASELIDKTRMFLDEQLSGLLAESYGRAYQPMVMLQQCSELEEILEYKVFLKDAGIASSQVSLDTLSSTSRHNSNVTLDSLGGMHSGPPGSSGDDEIAQQLFNEALKRKNLIAEKWRKRIRGCRHTGISAVPVWRSLLNVRRMVLSDREDIETWLEFAELCRDGENPALAERILNMHPGGAYSEYPESKYNAPLMPAPSSTNSTVFGGLSERSPSSFFGNSPNLHRSASAPQSNEGGYFAAAVNSMPPTYAPLTSPMAQGHGISSAFGGFSPQPGQGINKNLTLGMSDLSSSYQNALPVAQMAAIDRRVELAILNQLWSNGQRERAVEGLEHLLQTFSLSDNNVGVSSSAPGASSSGGNSSRTHLACLLRFGQWKVMMAQKGGVQNIDRSTRKEVLALYHRATKVDSSSYSAWHAWGLANFRGAEEIKHLRKSPISGDQHNHVTLMVNAAVGLLRAIALGTRIESALVTQDMLCVLSLWFRYDHVPELLTAISAGVGTVHTDNWLGVLPQLIARLDHPEVHGRALLHELLVRMGAKHAQVLVYPLTVAVKSVSEERNRAATEIMSVLRSHHPKVIDEASMVATELVRVAILWQETWHDSLEDASHQYFGQGNVQAMLDNLFAAHELMNLGPFTLKEMSFVQKYGQDLHDAYIALQNYKHIMNEMGRVIPEKGAAPVPAKHQRKYPLAPEESYLAQAWDLYYTVFKRINEQISNLTSLELQYCSPALANARDLDLGVPGTYQINGSCVRIQSFNQSVVLIRSKQHPRKIKIHGEDGLEYAFLLKGLEDLRQDERAMQLFGLVNALFSNDARTANEDLAIQRYAVLPLSPTAGLSSWVPRCDTLHDVIRDFRDSRKILLNIECKLMQQMAPNSQYDQLSSMQKLEVFEYALANTTGEDVAKVLWHRSETSETWLEKRNNYTRSLAVMSMVGYILGLGDRHPSNLMLARSNGKIIHIDFGDCFEVAMHRDKFPEKVPFRLTRMLVNALEVSGIEGSFRFTCEKVMSIMRENKDSLIATLEAFVHDPLISFRLLRHTTTAEDQNKKRNKKASNAESIKRVDKPSTASSTFAVHSIPGEVVDDPVKTVEPSVTLAANVTEVEAPKGGGMTRSKNVQNLSLDYQAPSSANSSNVSALSVSLSNHTSSLGNWVPHTPAPVIESPGDDPVRSDKKLPSSTHLEPVLEVDTNSTDVATVVNEDESETLPVAKPKMKKMKKVKSSSECLDLVDLEGGAVDIDNEEYCMGDGVNESEEEEEEEEEEPLVINGATIAPVVKPTEADRGVRPPVTQSYRPNLHLDMASMAESIVEPSLVGSVAVRKVSASVIASRGLTAESFNPRRRKSLVQSKLDTPQIGEKNETVQVNYAENSAASSGADQIDISASAGAPHTGDKCVPLEVQTPQTVLVDTESERDVEDDELVDDVLTARAVFVIKRVMDKLAGLDFEERSVKASQCVGVHGPSEACSASNHKCKSPNSNEATGIAGTPNVEGPQSSGSAKNNTSITNMVKAREPLVVKEQVDRIIRQAVSNENLCQSFSGWCAFW